MSLIGIHEFWPRGLNFRVASDPATFGKISMRTISRVPDRVCRNLDAATRSGRDRLDFLFFTLLSLAPKKSPFSYAFAVTPNDMLAHFAFGILD